ncbi:sugar kinase [Clostridium sp. C8]|uniref:sugar kinase n=1 Tax=Clostridium sp. C8 TaxID=1667357 RepID=UPI00062E627A|nr:sugar kinase [Clostridium sp. C8]KLE14173.1 2-dehydro-3-deoxygluconokinase [Clostridium sp. C8]
MKVAGSGEILLRLATKKGVLISNSNEFNVNYGGGEANVLISLANFKVDTRLITKISSDSLGEAMLIYLKSKNVDTRFISRENKRTPIYFLEAGSGNRSSKVIYDRLDSAFSYISEDDFSIEEALKDVDIFHFSGITLAIAEKTRKLTFKILEYCRENNILVSYDSNYRAKMWSLEEASQVTEKVLPYVNIFSGGILDAENILNMECNLEDKYEKLKYYYDEISKKYPNIKHIFSSFRDIKSSSVNTLQCNYYTNKTLFSSSIQTIDDIVDRVGGGDALTAGVIYGILNKKTPEYICEFAVSASVLKHTIYGDANLVSIEEVENLVDYGVGKISR